MLALCVVLVVAGVSHFVSPDFFDPIVPPWLPGPARAYTYASGLAEIAVGLALLPRRTRRAAAFAAAALFVAVYPANLYMAWDWRDRPLADQLVAWGRLPLQIPLVWWAIRVAGNAARRRDGA
jgi:uncharacterized membrane protein